VRADRYDPAALVNKGNVLMACGEAEKACHWYRTAVQSDASCVEALYNLALANKRLQLYDEALQHFAKLNVILRNDAQVERDTLERHPVERIPPPRPLTSCSP